MPQNMSFWSNWVDMVHSLQKISKQFRLVNLCIIGTCSASFATTFCSNKTVRNDPKHEFSVQWSGSGTFILKILEATSFGEFVR
jgi:hypothetical protein